MSINRDMKKCVLQEHKPIRSPSGAQKDHWVDVMEIDVAIYKKNDMRTISSAKYIESTHTGYTHSKDIQVGKHRLVQGDTVYEITDCNPEGRLTNLLLKVVM